MNHHFELPKLYKLTSTGKVQTWKIAADGVGHTDHYHDGYELAEICAVYGLQDGKKQIAKEVIVKGKNLGKANETTPYEQAVAEAQSQWEQKVKKGYVENLDDAKTGKVDTNFITGGIDPMLAHSYEKQSSKITYPAYVQPKLDGHRCIAIIQDGKCTLWSRTRKSIKSMPHIVTALEQLFPTGSLVLDGELYNHDYRDKFEELTSKIKQDKPMPGGEVVQYWIYDVAMPDKSFDFRFGTLVSLEKTVKAHDFNEIVIVPTEYVDSEEEMVNVFGTYIDYGFEGLMLRNAKGLYKNKRSYDLQKVKMMQDTEFPIIGVKEGKGKMAGKAIFVCSIPGTDNIFSVKMKGALESLTKYMVDESTWQGKMLTVQFQNFSSEGVPRFPVGLRIREDI